MRLALTILLALAACGVDTADKSSDSTACPQGDSFCVPYDHACDRSQSLLCSDGFGYCTMDGVCRRQCEVTEYPRCPANRLEHHEVGYEGADSCTCW